jgi:phytoene dehydrogenase-like protein
VSSAGFHKRTHYDAIVVGSGHNGLTNAAFLARAGLRVLLLERNDYLGGASVSRELHPGWTYSNCSYVCSLLRPEIYRELDLARHGLQVVPYGGGLTFLSDGDILGRYVDPAVRRREIARHSPRDADAYPRFMRDVMRQCRLIRPLLMRTPADPLSFRPRDVGELIYLYRRLYDLGEKQLNETIRFYTMSVAEFLGDYFESEIVRADLAGSGIIGSGLGVYSPGTAYVLLHHYMGDVDGHMGAWGYARGGMGAVAAALSSALRAAGGEIRTASGVERIAVRGGRACGVVLESGEQLNADLVVSSLDPHRTFLGLVPPEALTERFRERVRRFRVRGSSSKLNIALDGLPRFPALAADNPLIRGDMHFVDSLERLERAYDDWKYGSWSRDPYLDLVIPSLTDPTMAPPGKHMMSVFVQYVPPTLDTGRFRGAWTDDSRAALADSVIAQIERHSPGFRDLIAHMEIRTPQELEGEIGLTGGNIFHGELTLDQMFFNRPVPGYAQYRAPLPGLYLCGSSNHPGGGVMAAPGANAAREILRDLRRRNTVPATAEADA